MAAPKSMVSRKKKAASSSQAKPSSGVAATKRAAPRAKAGRLVGSHATPPVSVVTAGGYTVFGSPVRPAHLTPEQIAAAIAELD